MDEIATHENRTQVIRWLDESRDLLGLLPGVLDNLRSVEQECAQLRQSIDEYRAENDRLRREGAELMDALTSLIHKVTRPVNEIVETLRVHSPRPESGVEGSQAAGAARAQLLAELTGRADSRSLPSPAALTATRADRAGPPGE